MKSILHIGGVCDGESYPDTGELYVMRVAYSPPPPDYFAITEDFAALTVQSSAYRREAIRTGDHLAEFYVCQTLTTAQAIGNLLAFYTPPQISP